jgi:hypothetical protein
MKSYKELLEELTPSQKSKVDSWTSPIGSREADKISSHVFPVGQDRMTIPLEPEEVIPHPDIKNHLESHGYKVKDYRKGLATDKYGRDTNIGRVLQKTKAPEEHIKTFTNDPERQSSKNSNLQVVISKHPHDVVGMSTDRGWSSCMDMGGGSEKEHLQHDIHKGTHVAYLTKSGDNDIKNPVARIALKPHYGNTDKHTILRAEDRQYGGGGDAFTKTVNNFIEKHYPMNNKNTHYNKDDSLYNDSWDHQINYNHPNLITPDTENLHHEIAINGKKEHLDQLVDHPDEDIRKLVARHGHKDHLDKLVNDPDNIVRRIVASHGHKEHLDKLVNDPMASVRNIVVDKGHKEHLDKLVNDPNDHIRANVASHGHKEHLDKLVNDPDTIVRRNVASKGHKEHMDKLLNDPESDVRVQVARHGDRGHINKLINDPDSRVRRQVAEYTTNPKHIETLSNDPDHYVRWRAFDTHDKMKK